MSESDGIRYYAGHIFIGPDGQEYRLLKDAHAGEAIRADQFEAFGGAPEPESHTPIPDWLQALIKPWRPPARFEKEPI